MTSSAVSEEVNNTLANFGFGKTMNNIVHVEIPESAANSKKKRNRKRKDDSDSDNEDVFKLLNIDPKGTSAPIEITSNHGNHDSNDNNDNSNDVSMENDEMIDNNNNNYDSSDDDDDNEDGDYENFSPVSNQKLKVNSASNVLQEKNQSLK